MNFQLVSPGIERGSYNLLPRDVWDGNAISTAFTKKAFDIKSAFDLR